MHAGMKSWEELGIDVVTKDVPPGWLGQGWLCIGVPVSKQLAPASATLLHRVAVLLPQVLVQLSQRAISL